MIFEEFKKSMTETRICRKEIKDMAQKCKDECAIPADINEGGAGGCTCNDECGDDCACEWHEEH